MSRGALMADVTKFCGHRTNECFDQIKSIASRYHYSVILLDPEYNPGSIITDASRLNVFQDKAGKVSSFSIG
jgi:hypothetical protein